MWFRSVFDDLVKTSPGFESANEEIKVKMQQKNAHKIPQENDQLNYSSM